jgi:hypothetical protein
MTEQKPSSDLKMTRSKLLSSFVRFRKGAKEYFEHPVRAFFSVVALLLGIFIFIFWTKLPNL